MKKQEIRQKAAEVVRDAVRDSNLVRTAELLNQVPEMLECIELDRGHILQCVNAELRRRSSNPFNALLGVFGLRIVSTTSTMRHVADRLDMAEPQRVQVMSGEADEALVRLNAERLQQSLNGMIASLAKLEKEQNQRDAEGRDRDSLLHSELDKSTREAEQLRVDLTGQRKMVADRLQYMLSLCADDPESPVAQQVAELLEDMDIQVYREGQEAPFAEDAMFTVLTVGPGERRRGKPCLVYGGQILCKGLKFQTEV